MRDIPRSHKIIYAIMLVMILLLAIYRIATFGKLRVRSDTQDMMGTYVTVKLYSKSDSQFKKVCGEVTDSIEKLENIISVEKEDAVFYKLNKNQNVDASAGTDKLKEVLEISDKCGGLISPAAGKLVKLWNITADDPKIPSKSDIKTALKSVDNDNIVIEGEKISLKKGAKLDLGAYGKGMACDEAKKVLENSDITGGAVLVGGSILLYGSQPDGKSYSVAVRDPQGDTTDTLGVLKLDSGVISTSGDYEKYFEKGGKRYHHIFDLKSGYPVDNGLTSVTVVCESGVLSDALSTACFVAGIDDGMKLLKEFSAEGVFVDHNNNIYITDGLKDKFELQKEDYKIVDAK